MVKQSKLSKIKIIENTIFQTKDATIRTDSLSTLTTFQTTVETRLETNQDKHKISIFGIKEWFLASRTPTNRSGMFVLCWVVTIAC